MIRHIKKLTFNQWLALVLVVCVVLITISILINDGVVIKHKGLTDLYLHHDGEIESNYDIDGATIYNR